MEGFPKKGIDNATVPVTFPSERCFHVKITTTTMPLETHEIKRRLGHGSVTKIAKQTNRTIGHVSQVLNRKRRDRKVEVAAARKMRMKWAEVFGDAA